ncbi:uncharacterized protein K452DRAFT_114247 [Aplosporella prunicola CBS 121167]|uniref:Uncharacterized protein n=1 Tax=Aplosporella prunicola CBS 121167 TaxID=1176127 RepID=A0A6A6B1K7_9PEZI|nr:uncharacterized protein K452DRAFT_114247 [Aplosporella prunicola CBS 121167]KAF2137104.1 hypothetical protein K452DRAFT_114247 [Aplosporella prunicola CBS 121167]
MMLVGTLMVDITCAIFIRTELQSMDREAPIRYDLDCRALHIFASPWKHYLDINGYARGYRVARSWFDV